MSFLMRTIPTYTCMNGAPIVHLCVERCRGELPGGQSGTRQTGSEEVVMLEFCSNDVLNKLLHGQSISDQLPWASNDEEEIVRFYRSICDDLCREFFLSSEIEWEDYGSGYASYIDAWFYRDNDRFNVSSNPECRGFTGLFVLFSRLSPYFVVGEGAKSWNVEGGGRSYLPSFELVDDFTHQPVADLFRELEPRLTQRGLVRLCKDDLGELLPENSRVPTILCDPPYRAFDALFHWAD